VGGRGPSAPQRVNSLLRPTTGGPGEAGQTALPAGPAFGFFAASSELRAGVENFVRSGRRLSRGRSRGSSPGILPGGPRRRQEGPARAREFIRGPRRAGRVNRWLSFAGAAPVTAEKGGKPYGLLARMVGKGVRPAHQRRTDPALDGDKRAPGKLAAGRWAEGPESW